MLIVSSHLRPQARHMTTLGNRRPSSSFGQQYCISWLGTITLGSEEKHIDCDKITDWHACTHLLRIQCNLLKHATNAI